MSTDAASSTSYPCPNCGKNHANAHLDQALYCYDCGNPGRFGWHTECNRTMYALQRACNTHAWYEPGSVASANASQVRCDGRNDTVLPGAAAAHFDVRTTTITQSKTATVEAAFPGITVDRFETAKTRKHAPSHPSQQPCRQVLPHCGRRVWRHRPTRSGFPGHGLSARPRPTSDETYWLRRLAVNNCVLVPTCTRFANAQVATLPT